MNVSIHRLLAAAGLLAALIAVALLSARAQPADAQAGAKPTPCNGIAATDAAGDQAPLIGTAGENLDITSFFFTTQGTKTDAHIVVKNLSKAVPPQGTGVSWYAEWTTADDTVRFVNAQVDSAGTVAYGFGTLDGSLYSAEGETSGSMIEGADGVISIRVPPDLGATSGRKLGAPVASAFVEQNAVLVGRLDNADLAPDTGGGKDYTVTSCGAAATPTPSGTSTPGATPTPTPTGGGGGGGGTATLKVSLVTKSVKAKSAKKSIKLKLKSSEAVTGLQARLAKGSKLVGSGKLAKLNGSGSITLKVRGVKKGSYSLVLTGKTAAGKTASKTFKLRVK